MIALIQKFMFALALGALIGIEREKTQQLQKRKDIAGIRTFMIISLLGSLSAYLSSFFSQYFMIAILFAFSLFLLLGYYLSSAGKENYGLTTELSALTAYLIGIMVYVSPKELPIALTIIITLILWFRIYLHHFVRTMRRSEFLDTLKFLIIAFVVLPLLPDQYFGPFDAFNPHKIWMIVVLVSGVSYVGYALLKFLKAKNGIELTGLAGGFVSSTAVMSSMAAKSKLEHGCTKQLAQAAVLASSTMMVRVLILVFLLQPSLALQLILPLLVMSSIGYAWTMILWRNGHDKDTNIEMRSPFTLKPAITFAIVFTVIVLVTKIALSIFGSRGIFITSTLSGLADVDAIAISVIELAKTGLGEKMAIICITLATTANTMTKIVIGGLFGSRDFFRAILPVLACTVLAGILMSVFLVI